MAELSDGQQSSETAEPSSSEPSSSMPEDKIEIPDPLDCPKCDQVFKFEGWWRRHVRNPPASCIQQQVRIARAAAGTSDPADSTEPSLPLHKLLSRHKKETFVPDHIPKSVRRAVASALSEKLRQVVERNDIDAWTKLLLFTYRVLGSPRSSKEGKTESLPTLIRRNLKHAYHLPLHEPPAVSAHVKKRLRDETVARNVSRKLQDGDISGAVRVLISEETVLPFDAATILALRAKHPEGAHVALPVMDERPIIPQVTGEEVRRAIKSFPNGSAAGPDGMRPQYLKELMGVLRGVDLDHLCELLASVADQMLEGVVPDAVRSILFGANLFAFRKKDGGVRPIAVGLTLRRMVSRIVSRRCQPQGPRLQPQQLGFATPGGSEAAVHAARYFVERNRFSPNGTVLLKLDVKNAFNALDRTSLLEAVARHIPAYLPYVQLAYGAPTHLIAGKETISSSRGVQQGDPFGPLGYCLGTEDAHSALKSELTESYLDDDLLGGVAETVLADFGTIVEKSRLVGLELNVAKCELFVLGGSQKEQEEIRTRAKALYPGLLTPPIGELVYLGSPLVPEATPIAIEKQIARAKLFSSRMEILPAHHAQYLLRNSLGPCRMNYLLRTSRAYDFRDSLSAYDEIIRDTFSQIHNVDVDETRWTQLSLPLSFAGFGIRRTRELALSAFLASAHSVHSLTFEISGLVLEEYLGNSVERWQKLSNSDPPFGNLKMVQKMWDTPVMDALFERLKSMTRDEPTAAARLKAVACKEASAWLRAPPVQTLGYFLSDKEVRAATALRLGAPVALAHQCVCGTRADCLGHHALSCGRTKARIPAHNSLNKLLARALGSIDYNTELEPVGLSDMDGRRPDGITLTLWVRGKYLAWDVTAVNTFSLSRIAGTTTKAGTAANEAEANKIRFYEGTLGEYAFEPLGFETMGPWGNRAKTVLQKIGDALRRKSGEPRSMDFLRQRFSVEIQRGNAARVLGTASPSENLDEIFSALRAPVLKRPAVVNLIRPVDLHSRFPFQLLVDYDISVC